MFQRVIISVIVFLLSIFIISGPIFAQTQQGNSDLEKIIDINNKITPEYIQEFAKEKSLLEPEIPKAETLQELLSKKKFDNYSYIEQKIIGKALLEEFVANKRLIVEDPTLSKYVASVGKLIACYLDNKEGITYTFIVIDSPEVKMYSFPGGYFVITKGYLKILNNEAQLAASLAREITATNKDYLMQSLVNNKEALTYLNYLKDIINKSKTPDDKPKLDISNDPAKEPFSDPLKSLDYYASPTIENLFTNKSYVAKKLLNKMLVLMPSYETILEKDLVAIKALSDAGYDERSAKDLLQNLNKEKQQEQVINRSINLENWLNNKNFNKQRNNKVEGRYYMMVERLNY